MKKFQFFLLFLCCVACLNLSLIGHKALVGMKKSLVNFSITFEMRIFSGTRESFLWKYHGENYQIPSRLNYYNMKTEKKSSIMLMANVSRHRKKVFVKMKEFYLLVNFHQIDTFVESVLCMRIG